jgi:hypothetical protein
MNSKILLLFVLVFANSWLYSTTWHIKQDGTGNFTTIQEGINASSDSDTVLVYPATYYENINYNGKNITVASLELITGNEAYIDSTIIDGQRISSCVSIVSEETDTCLRGLTITNGQGTGDYPLFGGGISIWGESNLMVHCDVINCIFTENYAYNSAGMCIRDAFVFLSGCSIRENYALYDGGGLGILDDSQVTFDSDNRCNIYNNFAAYMIEILISSIYINELTVIVDTFTVADPTDYFIGNTNGSINMEYNFDILESYIEPIDNDLYVSPDGDDTNSGLMSDDPLKTINLAVRNIASNAENPRTVHLASGTYSVSANQQLLPFGCKALVNIIGEDIDTTIIDGEMGNYSFFLALNGYENSLLKNITFQNGFSGVSLLSIHYSDSIKFENINIQNGIITTIGAAINSSTAGGNIQLKNVIVNNTETQDGGNAGAWFNGTTFFKAVDCTFSNNICVGSSAFSAGLYAMSSGDIIVENCKFFDNSTTSTNWQGWASAFMNVDYNDELDDTYINNCLFYDNVNINGKSTIYAKSLNNGMVHFTNNTLINNESPFGIEFQGNIDFRNNILRNEGDYEIALFDKSGQGIISIIDITHSNILGGQSAIYNQNNANIVNWGEGNIDEYPLFDSLGTYPFVLLEGSPCIDTGTPDTTGLYLPPWDLLHNHRVWDGDGDGIAIIDMGCYEYGAEPYVEVTQNQIPNTQYQLYNYPNPFNPETKIVFNLPEEGNVKLEIYNIKGQKVKTLLDCYMSPGRSEMIWNSRDDNQKRVASGVYLYQLQTPSKSYVRKCMLLK